MEMTEQEYLRARVDALSEMLAAERLHAYANTAVLLLILWLIW